MFKPVMADQIIKKDGSTIGLFRCETDGALVLNTPESLKLHSGHRVKAPVMLKWQERMGIRLGWIK